MKKLNIRDYSCEKPRRKYFGNITFLHVQDGKRFLDAHGANSLNSPLGKYAVSRLRYLETDVVCHLSKRAPQEFTLKSLTHTAEQRNSSSRVVIEDHHSVSLCPCYPLAADTALLLMVILFTCPRSAGMTAAMCFSRKRI